MMSHGTHVQSQVTVHVCCSVLQCVAMCCSVLQHVMLSHGTHVQSQVTRMNDFCSTYVCGLALREPVMTHVYNM